MSFIVECKTGFAAKGVDALSATAPFDEIALLKANLGLIARGIELPESAIHIGAADDDSLEDPETRKQLAMPLKPSFGCKK